MILFKKDIHEQPVYEDLLTHNKSFLKMVKVLDSLGVENNRFFLTCYDKDLLGIDPFHLKDTSLELKTRIAEEIANNFWYYIRNIVRVPEAGNAEGAPFILNRFNLAMYWCSWNNIDTFNCIQRQFGKTTASVSLLGHPFYFSAEDYDIGFLSKDTTSVQEVVKRLKKIRDTHPPYLIEKQRKDGDNKEGLCYFRFNNTFRTFVAQPSKLGAEKVMRSLSLPLIMMDEFPYCNHNWISFPAAVNSAITAREQARNNDMLTTLNIITTAGDPSTEEGAYAYGIRNECMDFYDKLYDCKNKEELTKTLNVNSKRSMFYISYSYKQLGKTDEWFHSTVARSGADEGKTARDLLNIWRPSTSNGGLDPKLIKEIMDSEKDPISVKNIDGLIFKYYVTDFELETYLNKPLVASTDGAENIEKDFSTFLVFDPKTLKPIITMQTNIINLNIFAKNIFEFLVAFNKTVWIPERNHVGSMIIDTVVELMRMNKPALNPYKRIFNHEVNEATNSRDIKESEYIGAEKSKFGFKTSGGNYGRKFLYGTVLPRALDLCKNKIIDKTLISQITGLIRDKTGRLDHPVGGNDDMVVSFNLAMYLILYAKNLDYYGITYNDIFSVEDFEHITDKGVKVTKENYLELLKSISQVEKFIKMTSSPVLRSAYEEDLNRLKDLLVEYELNTTPVSREQFMSDFQEKQATKQTFNLNDMQRVFGGNNDKKSRPVFGLGGGFGGRCL